MKFFENLLEGLDWIRLFLFAFLLGLVIGGSLYVFTGHMLFKMLGVSVFISGIFLGIFFANSASRAGGTQNTLSQLNKTTDWDALTDDMRKKDEKSLKLNDDSAKSKSFTDIVSKK